MLTLPAPGCCCSVCHGWETCWVPLSHDTLAGSRFWPSVSSVCLPEPPADTSSGVVFVIKHFKSFNRKRNFSHLRSFGKLCLGSPSYPKHSAKKNNQTQSFWQLLDPRSPTAICLCGCWCMCCVSVDCTNCIPNSTAAENL